MVCLLFCQVLDQPHCQRQFKLINPLSPNPIFINLIANCR